MDISHIHHAPDDDEMDPLYHTNYGDAPPTIVQEEDDNQIFSQRAPAKPRAMPFRSPKQRFEDGQRTQDNVHAQRLKTRHIAKNADKNKSIPSNQRRYSSILDGEVLLGEAFIKQQRSLPADGSLRVSVPFKHAKMTSLSIYTYKKFMAKVIEHNSHIHNEEVRPALFLADELLKLVSTRCRQNLSSPQWRLERGISPDVKTPQLANWKMFLGHEFDFYCCIGMGPADKYESELLIKSSLADQDADLGWSPGILLTAEDMQSLMELLEERASFFLCCIEFIGQFSHLKDDDGNFKWMEAWPSFKPNKELGQSGWAQLLYGGAGFDMPPQSMQEMSLKQALLGWQSSTFQPGGGGRYRFPGQCAAYEVGRLLSTIIQWGDTRNFWSQLDRVFSPAARQIVLTSDTNAARKPLPKPPPPPGGSAGGGLGFPKPPPSGGGSATATRAPRDFRRGPDTDATKSYVPPSKFRRLTNGETGTAQPFLGMMHEMDSIVQRRVEDDEYQRVRDDQDRYQLACDQREADVRHSQWEYEQQQQYEQQQLSQVRGGKARSYEGDEYFSADEWEPSTRVTQRPREYAEDALYDVMDSLSALSIRSLNAMPSNILARVEDHRADVRAVRGQQNDGKIFDPNKRVSFQSGGGGVKRLPCHQFMIGLCKKTESECNYSHADEVCRPAFDEMSKRFTSRAPTGPGPNGATVSAMRGGREAKEDGAQAKRATSSDADTHDE